jgi:hypothetical protein
MHENGVCSPGFLSALVFPSEKTRTCPVAKQTTYLWLAELGGFIQE